jgi:Na+/H+ antiporter NhaD/arsenite permease-like protein
VVVVAGVVLIACLGLALLIWRGRQGRRERGHDPELDEALERMREQLRRPGALIAGAAVVALALVAVLARNPSRWPVLLLALAALGVAVAAVLVRRRRSG